MNRFVALLLIFCLPLNALAAHVDSAKMHIRSDRIVTIVGEIDIAMRFSVATQMELTANAPGPRLVVIQSGGGSVDEGYKIIQMLEEEKARTHRQLVCIAVHAAHSMAFNILTHCDVRLATDDATMVVHKVAIGGEIQGIRGTARNLRRIAEEMDETDEALNRVNAKAMHLSLAEYSKWADQERRWTSEELLEMGYLNGIAVVSR